MSLKRPDTVKPRNRQSPGHHDGGKDYHTKTKAIMPVAQDILVLSYRIPRESATTIRAIQLLQHRKGNKKSWWMGDYRGSNSNLKKDCAKVTSLDNAMGELNGRPIPLQQALNREKGQGRPRKRTNAC